jgi:hypothetical protein
LFRAVGIKRPKWTRNKSVYIQINLNIGQYNLNWFNYFVWSPTVTTTLKNLVTLYRKQGRNEAADQLDNCAVKIKKDPSAITQAIEVVQKVQMNDSLASAAAMAAAAAAGAANPAAANLINQTLTSSQSSNSRFGMYDTNGRNLNEVHVTKDCVHVMSNND